MGELSAIRGVINILRSGTTGAMITRPSLAGSLVLTNGAAPDWTLGGWVQFAAANDLAAHMLVGVLIVTESANTNYAIQFGTGAAGSEVVIGQIQMWGSGASTARAVPFFFVPLQIPANARVAARSAGAANATVNVLLHFLPRPL